MCKSMTHVSCYQSVDVVQVSKARLLATALHPTTQECICNNGYTLCCIPSKPQSGSAAAAEFPLEGILERGSAVSAHRGSSGGTSLKMKRH